VGQKRTFEVGQLNKTVKKKVCQHANIEKKCQPLASPKLSLQLRWTRLGSLSAAHSTRQPL